MWGVLAGYFYGKHRERKAHKVDAELTVGPKGERHSSAFYFSWGGLLSGWFLVALWIGGWFLNHQGPSPLSISEARDIVYAHSITEDRSDIPCRKAPGAILCFAKDMDACNRYEVRKKGDYVWIAREIPCRSVH
jgi:hypothetical protein